MKRLATLGLAAVLASSPLSAQVLLNDHFNTENSGNTQLNYTSFANWTVGGQVDLVKSGDFGINCVGNIGACVDLDGSGGPGDISSQYFSFNAGDRMKFSVMVSGNQRSRASYDDLTFDMTFSSPTFIGNWMGTGGWAGAGYFGATTSSLAVFSDPILGSDPFSLWTFEFDALTAGSVQYTLGTPSADNVGPIVDDVSVQRSTITPEPSTWAMLAFGMSAVGFVSRRRARKA